MATATVLTPKMSSQLDSLSSQLRSSMDDYLAYERGSLLRNKYKFVSNLQNGSFGKVTCAYNIFDNSKVAIKALKKTVPGVSFMARHEIAIMKKVGSHENYCQLLESFETKKYIVLVLEFVGGGDLYDAIHNQTPLGVEFQNNPQFFVSLVNQLAEAIKHAHSKGVYHRDIKPENVLLMENGSIKLCDWGLSTNARKCRDFNVGTEKYMAPDALHQQAEYYDAKAADCWSLAITLLFTLFGKCPFRKAETGDVNYMNFCKSKEFLYDYYPNMNSVTFDAIVQKFMVERDLDAGVQLLNTDGSLKGFTLDQEFKIELANRRISPDVSGLHENAGNDMLGGEFFMFDNDNDFEVKEIEELALDEQLSSFAPSYQPQPIEIVSDKSGAAGYVPSSVATSCSLFDPQVLPSLTHSYNTGESFDRFVSSKSWCEELDEENPLFNIRRLTNNNLGMSKLATEPHKPQPNRQAKLVNSGANELYNAQEGFEMIPEYELFAG